MSKAPTAPWMPGQARRGAIALLSVAFLLVGSGCISGSRGDQERTVVTSLSPLGSIMRNVMGDRIGVLSLASPRDVHTGRLTPPTRLEVQSLERELVGVVLAGGVDAAFAEAVTSVTGPGTRVWVLAELTATVGSSPSAAPWVDPDAARSVATEVRNIAVSLAPADGPYFERNLENFFRALDNIDAAISQTASSVPPSRRKAAGTTESMRPFFERYGFRYFSEASEGGPEALAATMRREGVTVLYVNAYGAAEDAKRADRILEQAGGSFRGTLFDAALPGPPGSLYHTYFGLLIENARQAFGPLGAEMSRLDELRPVDVAP